MSRYEDGCGLLQLAHSFPPEILYANYWYRSGTNATMRDHLRGILRSYGRPITVPIENVINLTQEEIGRVETFVRKHRLKESKHNILFECSSKSGQSFVTPPSP
jgi:hypothetical protein